MIELTVATVYSSHLITYTSIITSLKYILCLITVSSINTSVKGTFELLNIIRQRHFKVQLQWAEGFTRTLGWPWLRYSHPLGLTCLMVVKVRDFRCGKTRTISYGLLWLGRFSLDDGAVSICWLTRYAVEESALFCSFGLGSWKVSFYFWDGIFFIWIHHIKVY